MVIYLLILIARITTARNNNYLGGMYKVKKILLDKIELIKIDEEE